MTPPEQVLLPPVDISPELRAAREMSRQRIDSYRGSENLAKRHGAMTKEVGRVASKDPEFAFTLAEGFDTPVQVNALAVIGKTTGYIGALSDARDIANSAEFTPGQQSEKLTVVAIAAAEVDPALAFEVAKDIPLPARRADSLIDIADKSKKVFGRRLHSETQNSNFSIDLIRRMVREADRTINDNNLCDEHRNSRLANVSAEHDLLVTYMACLRSGSSIPGALSVISRHVKGYIAAKRLDDLEAAADPSGELIIETLKHEVEQNGSRPSLYGWDALRLDPVVDGVELLKHFEIKKPEVARELLSVIRDGASAQLKSGRFEDPTSIFGFL